MKVPELSLSYLLLTRLWTLAYYYWIPVPRFSDLLGSCPERAGNHRKMDPFEVAQTLPG